MWAELWPDATAATRRSATSRTASTSARGSTPALTELLREAGVRPEAPPDEANWEAAGDLEPGGALAASTQPARRGSSSEPGWTPSA